ncbi:MAG: hypothetical protein RSA74_06485 [Chryseobacterium sp.]
MAAVVSVVEVQAVAVLEASVVAEVSEAVVLREGGNFKIFLKSLLIISLFSIISCQTQKTSFNPKKITKLEEAGYKVIFNKQAIDLYNITYVTEDKKIKTIQVNSNYSSQIINDA